MRYTILTMCLAILSGCGASAPHVRKLQNNTYSLGFPRDAVPDQFWIYPNKVIPIYMEKQGLIPQECRNGVVIIEAGTLLSPDAYAYFECIP
ncbi:hypothetical protein FACS1894158_16560 [Betaproteobacteria bacterium]|nr:hypothetical protein FACS1894158_16560 [Betaproteobacteria bacterium]GHU16996.1 hypothetical protein FACS189475_00110 [Betaproteobacteria bacterium]